MACVNSRIPIFAQAVGTVLRFELRPPPENGHISSPYVCLGQEVHVSFINSSRGLACRVDLPNLAVLSTDRTFRPRDDAEGGGVFAH